MDKVRSLCPFFLGEPSLHALTTGSALLFERHTDPADRSAIRRVGTSDRGLHEDGLPSSQSALPSLSPLTRIPVPRH